MNQFANDGGVVAVLLRKLLTFHDDIIRNKFATNVSVVVMFSMHSTIGFSTIEIIFKSWIKLRTTSYNSWCIFQMHRNHFWKFCEKLYVSQPTWYFAFLLSWVSSAQWRSLFPSPHPQLRISHPLPVPCDKPSSYCYLSATQKCLVKLAVAQLQPVATVTTGWW